MIVRSTLTWGFCLLMMAVGASMIVGNFGTAADGWTLHRHGEQIEATITNKRIDRPARSTGARTESVTVNDTTVRSIPTYFYDYLLTVSYPSGNGTISATAPVDYARWHSESAGKVITVAATAQVHGYVDAAPRATLLYALKQMGIGLLIICVGVAALWLPEN